LSFLICCGEVKIEVQMGGFDGYDGRGFDVGIDTRIVIVGLPQVASQLQADAEQAIWITQSYVLANTVLLLLIGRLSDIFGRVKIYTVGFGVFTIGSALTLSL
jgi:MFS family permease